MNILFERMAIVGVGLIGGSLAKAVKEKKLVGEVLGVGRSEERLESARKLGIIDRYSGRMNELLGEADLVVVAGPVGVIVDLVREIIPFLKKGTIITDVGSVKKKIVEEVEAFIPGSLYFVGGHPIAGTENSGFEASFSTLFEGRKCIITPVSTTDSHALERVKELWTQVGSVVACMDSEEHDEVFAAVSHLPHIVAYSMVNSLLKAKGFEKNIFSFSAGGFKDFTRIAASDPVMWKDIALMNKDKLLSAIKLFQEYLEELKEAIEREDGERLLSEFQKSREFKRLMD
ncbi:MAG: prephenate dehydrogenase/arogenate dehydrogenase family protein [Deltaproteobacteria bacterium]|nr:prephenate dehydrogenase/arogenate dehydrogenase family protein [Deltaproteobacteria bacterium]